MDDFTSTPFVVIGQDFLKVGAASLEQLVGDFSFRSAQALLVLLALCPCRLGILFKLFRAHSHTAWPSAGSRADSPARSFVEAFTSCLC